MDDPHGAALGAGLASTPLRERLNRALFDLSTPLGRRTNVAIMGLIVVSVGLAMVATVSTLPPPLRAAIEDLERAVSVVFAVEYVLRLYAARRPLRYALGFYGIVDLLTWLPLLLGQGNVALRLLRIVRLLKLLRYMGALRLFLASMRDAGELVAVVVGAISVIAVIAGNLIHLLEPATFSDAFVGAWWALVTMTTVGYGDLVPASGVGKVMAAALMLTGITMFAVLTGTISVKVARMLGRPGPDAPEPGEGVCPHCGGRLDSRPGGAAAGRDGDREPVRPSRCR
ncbi:MAG: potassium channel family protein [Ectothiorhodospiraceae bacterium]|nr:potassium channel family protein [Chromatiales bacterium]MCP5153874.1 potassium channel family protein [Ectothiorhodospiraceae bacterium]